MNVPWYTLEIESHFVAFSVNIGGIVLATDRNIPACDERIPINQWIFSGFNPVDAKLWVQPTWEELPAEMDFLLRICRYVPGSDVPEILSEIKWAKSDDWPEIPFPVQLKTDFVVDWDFPAWTWADAERLPDDSGRDPTLKSFLKTVHRAMSDKDVDAVVALCGIKAKEMANAFGIPLEERLRDQRTFFAGIFSNPGFVMKPFPEDSLLAQSHAQGRLLEITDLAGEPAVSTQALDGDAAFGLELFLCRREGLWTICR